MTVDEVVKLSGSQASLARGVGVSQQSVWKWIHGRNKVPADHVIATCRFLGWQLTPHQLRPDIYPNPSDGMPAGKPTSDEAA